MKRIENLSGPYESRGESGGGQFGGGVHLDPDEIVIGPVSEAESIEEGVQVLRNSFAEADRRRLRREAAETQFRERYGERLYETTTAWHTVERERGLGRRLQSITIQGESIDVEQVAPLFAEAFSDGLHAQSDDARRQWTKGFFTDFRRLGRIQKGDLY